MSTTKDFIEFVMDQIRELEQIRYKKMFGEYMVYYKDKPVLLVCDNTVFVKIHESIQKMMKDAEKGFPYEGAKEHYILDIDNGEVSKEIIITLEPFLKIPKQKK